ncbi:MULTISPECIES: hypothetical protein [unclassified Methylobacterium]|jgi:hypothetical protein|uniref:hypothetical protein n=1 Tax=unclassified Methylobacterium TaxID=2615210 RepID=UPI001353F6B4|nr:hypothetical protein [Methylobacterium sp. 2A]MWV22717.1 hypothetical protein [Methylobacterium sp. 2A]
MPEFVASLLAAAAFCLALLALNAFTRVLIQAHLGPSDLGETGLLQLGGALVAARIAYRRGPHRESL